MWASATLVATSLCVLAADDAQKPAEKPATEAPAPSTLPEAIPVVGRRGFVQSPYKPDAGYVDVRGYAPGTTVKCPYTGKMFLVPGETPRASVGG